MPGQRRSNLVKSRRRVEDEGEEEGGLATDVADDSHSEASILTDNDAGGDADDSDLSESDTKTSQVLKPVKEASKAKAEDDGKALDQAESTAPAAPSNEPAFETHSDTTAMMNGLKISEEAAKGEAVDFEAMAEVNTTAGSQEQQRIETPADRRRREHEDYKKRRDADPAFIPNRGAFFMHDQRHAGGSQNGIRPLGRGRGRGRGGIGGPFSPAK